MLQTKWNLGIHSKACARLARSISDPTAQHQLALLSEWIRARKLPRRPASNHINWNVGWRRGIRPHMSCNSSPGPRFTQMSFRIPFPGRNMNLFARVWNAIFTRLQAGDFHSFGQGASIARPFRGSNLRHMSIGPRVVINRDCWLQVIEPTAQVNQPILKIGADSGIGMGATISAARSVVLGEHVLLARNVFISDHGHAFEDVTVPIVFQGITEPRPVSIGDRTWLGQNVCVLPGVTIGRHCVVGANSVVISSLPDFTVAVGAPARVIKQYDPVTRCWRKLTSCIPAR